MKGKLQMKNHLRFKGVSTLNGVPGLVGSCVIKRGMWHVPIGCQNIRPMGKTSTVPALSAWAEWVPGSAYGWILEAIGFPLSSGASGARHVWDFSGLVSEILATGTWECER